jgi:TetR/AcrR family transcriptional regulator
VARARDPAKSRRDILDAASQLFAERGYNAVSLAEIGRVAGVARATPAYFFESKSGLYRAVLAQAQQERDRALDTAFAPLRDWEAGKTPPLRDAIERSIDGYLSFLGSNPAFARLIEWEALTGAAELAGVHGQAPISTALRAVRNQLAARDEANFDVTAVVVAIVSLCYLPIAHAATFHAGGAIDTTSATFRAHYRSAATDAIIGMLRTGRAIDKKTNGRAQSR